MKKILFVDDEPQLLRSIKRGLYTETDVWQMFFAGSAREALQLMDDEPVDVLVTDFRMPETSGLELLAQVEYRHPHTIRVMLTGQPGKMEYSQTVNLCHYFFWKPLKLEGFKRFLGRVDEVLTLLDRKPLIEQLNSITSLPIHPDSYGKLTTCLDDPDIQPKKLAYIAGKDIALAMQLFKLSSSANFTLENGINSLEEAIAYLNIETIRALAATQHMLQSGDRKSCHEFKLNQLQHHSFQVVRLAEALGQKLGLAEDMADILLAALLHDAGRIVLSHAFPEPYRRVFAASKMENIRFAVAENRILGADHAQVGAYLAALWGVPRKVVEAIRRHASDRPPALADAAVGHVVWHANRLAQRHFDDSREYYRDLNRDSKWAAFFQQTERSVETSG